MNCWGNCCTWSVHCQHREMGRAGGGQRKGESGWGNVGKSRPMGIPAQGGSRDWPSACRSNPTPGPSQAGPTQASRSCISDFTDAASSSPMGVAGALLKVRGHKSPYSELFHKLPPNWDWIRADWSACLF